MSQDDFAFPQGLVRGLGAAPAGATRLANPVPRSSSTAPHLVPQQAGWDERRYCYATPDGWPKPTSNPFKDGEWVQVQDWQGNLYLPPQEGVDQAVLAGPLGWVWYPTKNVPTKMNGIWVIYVPGSTPDGDVGHIRPQTITPPGGAYGNQAWIATAPDYWVYILNHLVPAGVVGTASTVGTGAVPGGAKAFQTPQSRFVDAAPPPGFSLTPCGCVVVNGKPPHIQVICDQRYLLSNSPKWPASWTSTGLTPAKMFSGISGYKKWLATGDVFLFSSDDEVVIVSGPEYVALTRFLQDHPQYAGPTLTGLGTASGSASRSIAQTATQRLQARLPKGFSVVSMNPTAPEGKWGPVLLNSHGATLEVGANNPFPPIRFSWPSNWISPTTVAKMYQALLAETASIPATVRWDATGDIFSKDVLSGCLVGGPMYFLVMLQVGAARETLTLRSDGPRWSSA